MEILSFLPLEQIKYFVLQALKIVLNLWWAWVPFFLWPNVKRLYLFFKQVSWDRKKIKRIVLEIRIPKEVVKPIRAMELVFTGIWQIWAPPNPRERWLDGEFQLSISFEIASIDGIPHFYIRTPTSLRSVLESHIYSQYPEAEIFEVDDYTKKVPQDIPNKDWDLFGTGYKFTKPNAYPIRTYTEFESEQEEEEKRVDPLSHLLEGMSSLKPGEQLWVQIVAKPLLNDHTELINGKTWQQIGEGERDRLVKRTKKEQPLNPAWKEAYQILKTGEPSKLKEEIKELLPPEMKMSPGEKDIVAALEKKIGKLAFSCIVRYIYLGKREVFFKPNNRLGMSYFTEFNTQNLNTLRPDALTLTKVKTIKWWFLDARRRFVRQRKLFRQYITRNYHNFPKIPASGDFIILNTEELATIYHFPGHTVAPASTMERIEAKKSEPPADLPIE